MSESKHAAEWKISIVKKYLSGEGSFEALAEASGTSEKTLRRWVFQYQKTFLYTEKEIYESTKRLYMLEDELRGLSFFRVSKAIISNLEDCVRIILTWCGRQDSNLHAVAEEPKGDVTSVKDKLREFRLVFFRKFITEQEYQTVPATVQNAVNEGNSIG